VGRSRLAARATRALVLGAAVLGLGACGVGTWETNASPSPVRAIHAAVLQNGKVLLVAGSGNDRDTFNAGTFRTSLWDPTTNTFTSVDTPWDAFCAGHAQLADGRLLVAGGTAGYEQASTNNTFSGSRKAYAFNPDTNQYERVANMTTARWYPTLLTMGDGSILTLAGQGADGRLTSTAQRFTGDAWTTDEQPPVRDDLAPGARQGWPLYPGLHLLADGRVFFSATHTFGGTMPPGIWDLASNTMHGVQGTPDLAHTDHAMSVLLPPAQDQRVMIIGGGNDNGSVSTDQTAIIDFTQPDPRYTAAAPLDTKKMYVSAVILPDRTVFETGGAMKMREYGNSYVHSAQIYNPLSNQWTKAKDSTISRGYHSSAVLLADGRVATFGSNPSDGSFELRIEIYSPEYMTAAVRPEITDVTNTMYYDRSYPMSVTTATDHPIKNVSLIRPMAVTHSVDANQRLVDVPFTTNPDGSLQLSITDNPNVAPPGWYMLFATDQAGVPSVASWVKIGTAPNDAPPIVDSPIPDVPLAPITPLPGDPVTGG
jgi:Galactose oxidase-like, Early set domain